MQCLVRRSFTLLHSKFSIEHQQQFITAELYDKEREEIEEEQEVVKQKAAEVAEAIRNGKHVVFYTG